MRKCLVLACIVLVGGCEASQPSDPTVDDVDAVARFEGPEGTEAVYDPGETVTLVAHYPSDSAAPGNVITAAEAAVAAWNSEVFDLAGHEEHLPHFNPDVVGGSSASGTIARLKYRDDECGGQNCGYCGSGGTVEAGVRTIEVRKLDFTDACSAGASTGRIVDDLSGVITHELLTSWASSTRRGRAPNGA